MIDLHPRPTTNENGRLPLWRLEPNGLVVPENGAEHYGDAAGIPLAAPMIALVPTPTGRGYWLVGADGGVFGYGDAYYPGRMSGNVIVSADLILDVDDAYRLVLCGLDEDGDVATFKLEGDTGHRLEREVVEVPVEVPAPYPVPDPEIAGAASDAEHAAATLRRFLPPTV